MDCSALCVRHTTFGINWFGAKSEANFLIHEASGTEMNACYRKSISFSVAPCRRQYHNQYIRALHVFILDFSHFFCIKLYFFFSLFVIFRFCMPLIMQEPNDFGWCCGPLRLHIIRLSTLVLAFNLIITITVIFVVSFSHFVLLALNYSNRATFLNLSWCFAVVSFSFSLNLLVCFFFVFHFSHLILCQHSKWN